MNELMTTKEVATYLRIKERKVYDLVAEGEIPFTKATGKYLFPKHLIDLWLARTASFPLINRGNALPAPPVIVGSHDPLLEWAVRRSGCGLAIMPGGSLDGVERFSEGQAVACGMHILDMTDGGYNVSVASQATVGLECVLLEWAWREQGLITQSDTSGIETLNDAVNANMRFIVREPQAGSRVLFQHLIHEAGLTIMDVDIVSYEARSETDVGMAISEAKADAGLGIRAVAQQLGLNFIPMKKERYDLLIRRRDFFEGPMAQLIAFAQTDAFKARAEQMEGYDISGFGNVHFNPT
jgi:putative molybdopterin biosynthesis protein